MDWLDEARRDPEALKRQLEREVGRLKSMAMGLLHGYTARPMEADELVNVVVVRVLLKFGSFQGTDEGKWVNWLKRIMCNALLDSIRRPPGYDERVYRERSDSVVGAIGEPIDPERTPRSRLHLKTMAAAIREAVQGLSPAKRIVFEMHVLDDVPLPVIAELLDCNYDAIRQRYNRSCEAIRDSLKLYDDSR